MGVPQHRRLVSSQSVQGVLARLKTETEAKRKRVSECARFSFFFFATSSVFIFASEIKLEIHKSLTLSSIIKIITR